MCSLVAIPTSYCVGDFVMWRYMHLFPNFIVLQVSSKSGKTLDLEYSNSQRQQNSLRLQFRIAKSCYKVSVKAETDAVA